MVVVEEVEGKTESGSELEEVEGCEVEVEVEVKAKVEVAAVEVICRGLSSSS